MCRLRRDRRDGAAVRASGQRRRAGHSGANARRGSERDGPLARSRHRLIDSQAGRRDGMETRCRRRPDPGDPGIRSVGDLSPLLASRGEPSHRLGNDGRDRGEPRGDGADSAPIHHEARTRLGHPQWIRHRSTGRRGAHFQSTRSGGARARSRGGAHARAPRPRR